MRWPWKRPETRSDYTAAFVDRIVAIANGDRQGTANIGATAAAATAGGILSRAFSAATVDPGIARTGLDPYTLSEIGAAFVFAGESVWVIETDEMGVRLVRASSWDITGKSMDGWRYRVTVPGPTDHEIRYLPGEAVLHPRINCAASEPHKGRSPLALAGVSASALANAERSIADEMSAPVGRLLPAPFDQLRAQAGETPEGEEPEDPLAQLETVLATLKGRSALVPTMAGNWDVAGQPQQRADWQSRRIGADPPQSVVELRRNGHDQILAAAGVPPMLFSSSGQANAGREALRFFLHSTLTPLGRILEVEASRKLGVAVRFSFDSLSAADIQGRARAWRALAGPDAAMSPEIAARLVGMAREDDAPA